MLAGRLPLLGVLLLERLDERDVVLLRLLLRLACGGGAGSGQQGPLPRKASGEVQPAAALGSRAPFCASQASHLALPFRSNIPGRAVVLSPTVPCLKSP